MVSCVFIYAGTVCCIPTVCLIVCERVMTCICVLQHTLVSPPEITQCVVECYQRGFYVRGI